MTMEEEHLKSREWVSELLEVMTQSGGTEQSWG